MSIIADTEAVAEVGYPVRAENVGVLLGELAERRDRRFCCGSS